MEKWRFFSTRYLLLIRWLQISGGRKPTKNLHRRNIRHRKRNHTWYIIALLTAWPDFLKLYTSIICQKKSEYPSHHLPSITMDDYHIFLYIMFEALTALTGSESTTQYHNLKSFDVKSQDIFLNNQGFQLLSGVMMYYQPKLHALYFFWEIPQNYHKF